MGTLRVFLFGGARAAATAAIPASQLLVGSRPPCEGRGPLADQDDELNTLVGQWSSTTDTKSGARSALTAILQRWLIAFPRSQEWLSRCT